MHTDRRALSLIERSLMPDRPCFFVTAGRWGGGKTTTLSMIFMAVLGHQAPGTAWSTDEEERRKVERALRSRLLQRPGARRQ
jgi:ABC-type proline/glycine betaine transport system ATPase subunit